ncbi:MAG: hypothetical protein ABMA14_27290, partial [Hyphomonadaceae bacterium]
MLVHPARERLVHKESAQWATAAKDEWHNALSAAATDTDRIDTVADFKKAYEELAKTEPSLP